MSQILGIENLSKHYGRIQAIKNLSFEVELGQVYGLLGPNGSGKTTTLASILGVVRPSAGKISWFGKDSSSYHRHRVGAILEQPYFYPWFTAYQNLRLTALIRGVDERSSSIKSALDLVELAEHTHQKVSSFSLGMRQRLSLASALVGSPDVLVLDEPTNGVDAKGIALIRSIITDLAKEGKTIILASHILDEVEKVCSHIAILKDGMVINKGAIAEVIAVDDSIEVAAEDMGALQTAVNKFKNVKSSEIKGDVLKVLFEEPCSNVIFGNYLFEKKIAVTHLVKRKRTLETHFLELMEKS